MAQPTPSALTIEYLRIREVVGWPRNPKKHDLSALDESFKRFGFVAPIVKDERTGRLVAGHGRLDQLAALERTGGDRPKNILTDPEGAWLVPVVRGNSFETEAEAEAYLLADNRITEIGGYDVKALDVMLRSVMAATPVGLIGTGYSLEDAQEIAKQAMPAASAGSPAGGDGAEPPPLPAIPRSKPGEIYTLGRHRLMCGSATNMDDVRRLTAGNVINFCDADPPYGIKERTDRDAAKRGPHAARTSTLKGSGPLAKAGKYRPIIGDESTDTAAASFNLVVELGIRVVVFWGWNHYADCLPPSPSMAVWDKRVEDHEKNDNSDCELAYVKHPTRKSVRIFRHLWNGLIKGSERGIGRVHPTQKPIALYEWEFAEWGEEGDRVLALFGGSGAVLIAAENTGRTCYVMEMDPGYCDVIRDRFRNETGQEEGETIT